VVDQTLEFTGRPSAFAGTVRHKPLKLPFTIEMWLIRPPLLHSRRGLLLALVDRNADDSLANIDGPFLLYETGFPKLGMQYLYNGKSQKVLAGGHDDAYRYQVPSGEWVHLAITVEPSQKAGHCLHTFYINGETGRLRGIGDGTGYGEVLDYPGLMSSVNQGLKPNYCDPTAALQGWGDGRFELRVGPRFLGAINDVLIWDRAVSATELRRSLHQYRPLGSTLVRCLENTNYYSYFSIFLIITNVCVESGIACVRLCQHWSWRREEPAGDGAGSEGRGDVGDARRRARRSARGRAASVGALSRRHVSNTRGHLRL